MSSSSESPALPETYLVKARELLDERKIDESARVGFFTALQSYLAGETDDELPVPPDTAKVWKEVFKLLAKFIAKTPPSPPRSPRSPKSASDKLHELLELNRLSPPVSFQERVLSSPPRKFIGEEPDGRDTPVNRTLDSEVVEPPKIECLLTESDYERLQKKKQESASKIAAGKEGSTSDFTIDRVEPLE
jgi:hypothetical protein